MAPAYPTPAPMSSPATTERLKGCVAELVMALRLTADDLAACDLTDLRDLDRRLAGMEAMVNDGMQAVVAAEAQYEAGQS